MQQPRLRRALRCLSFWRLVNVHQVVRLGRPKSITQHHNGGDLWWVRLSLPRRAKGVQCSGLRRALCRFGLWCVDGVHQVVRLGRPRQVAQRHNSGNLWWVRVSLPGGNPGVQRPRLRRALCGLRFWRVVNVHQVVRLGQSKSSAERDNGGDLWWVRMSISGRAKGVQHSRLRRALRGVDLQCVVGVHALVRRDRGHRWFQQETPPPVGHGRHPVALSVRCDPGNSRRVRVSLPGRAKGVQHTPVRWALCGLGVWRVVNVQQVVRLWHAKSITRRHDTTHFRWIRLPLS